MKLIVAGATGYVAQEVIRQIAPNGEGASKLKSVIIKDYDNYSEEVKEFAGADVGIWTVAVTPSKSKSFPFDEVTRICQTSTLAGLQAMHDAGLKKPRLMRGETENKVLAFAAQHSDEKFEACVAKPGIITRSTASWVFASALKLIMGVPNASVAEVAAAMLQPSGQQVREGAAAERRFGQDRTAGAAGCVVVIAYPCFLLTCPCPTSYLNTTAMYVSASFFSITPADDFFHDRR
ncbi:hypothetical protein DFH06DRAFT_1315999 [Mycena polygramma]|nr:hypothetical protein DFH06DRAFT_1315999 [Mycena polygramma]